MLSNGKRYFLYLVYITLYAVFQGSVFRGSVFLGSVFRSPKPTCPCKTVYHESFVLTAEKNTCMPKLAIHPGGKRIPPWGKSIWDKSIFEGRMHVFCEQLPHSLVQFVAYFQHVLSCRKRQGIASSWFFLTWWRGPSSSATK